MKEKWNRQQIAEANRKAYEDYSKADYTARDAEYQLQLYKKALNRIYMAVRDYQYSVDCESRLWQQAKQTGAEEAKQYILKVIESEARLIRERR